MPLTEKDKEALTLVKRYLEAAVKQNDQAYWQIRQEVIYMLDHHFMFSSDTRKG